jgi:hypothetical protein
MSFIWGYEKPRQDKAGKRWNFCLWTSDVAFSKEEKQNQSRRLFFWDDPKTSCGVVLFPPGSTMTWVRIENLMLKLAADSALRDKYKSELHFPLERHYETYPIFPEEIEASQQSA